VAGPPFSRLAADTAPGGQRSRLITGQKRGPDCLRAVRPPGVTSDVTDYGRPEPSQLTAADIATVLLSRMSGDQLRPGPV
jgi:hypothetical protein